MNNENEEGEYIRQPDRSYMDQLITSDTIEDNLAHASALSTEEYNRQQELLERELIDKMLKEIKEREQRVLTIRQKIERIASYDKELKDFYEDFLQDILLGYIQGMFETYQLDEETKAYFDKLLKSIRLTNEEILTIKSIIV
jgi:hypothetical protein